MLVILDRDGVINYESHEYIKCPDEWIEIPGSLAAIAKLKLAGYKVVVATNQSGVARGYYDESTLEKIHEKMSHSLSQHGATFDGIFYCPHHPDDNCQCRKPLPGLFHQIAAQINIPWSHAVAVGDSLRDIQAAQAVGCPAALVKTGNGESVLAAGIGLDGVEVFQDLASFVNDLLKQK